ncbi:tannase-domain-containing protein [Lophiostoma macrostomum CBS 122681]|uniref:Carboxylic ester hydrolase n=1 Tax=Lophiostoma macrostomum CBS 122681 TaxID=1314788 RepID=A0A6A6T9E2_9PLEO|nr:tannase-domain-containing protein [Lophiostoma macrostomum CBS 122681]
MKPFNFRRALLFASGTYYIAQTSALNCTSSAFQYLLDPNATILHAIEVPANGAYGDNIEAAYPANSTALPALCALTINVTSSAASSYQFGLFLPEDWNGRFSAVGNGGAAGGINWPLMGIMIDTLHQLYGHYSTLEKPLFFHPMVLWSEAAWAGNLPGNEPASVSSMAILDFQDPNWDWRTLNYSGIQEGTARFYTGGADMVPNQYDITPFAKRGGKLFHYHGQGDATIPYESSRTWYENTYRNVTTKGVDVDDFYRLFYVPGMLHCLQSNGDAPWYFGAGEQPGILGFDMYGVPGFRDAQHDAVLALIKWVEEDMAPDHIIATKYVNDTVSLGVKRQRKVCKYGILDERNSSETMWMKRIAGSAKESLSRQYNSKLCPLSIEAGLEKI